MTTLRHGGGLAWRGAAMAGNNPERLLVLEIRNELVLHEKEGNANYKDGFSPLLSAPMLLPTVASDATEADCSDEQLSVPRSWFSPGEATNMCGGNLGRPSTTHRAWGITHRADWRWQRCSLLLLPLLSSIAQCRRQHSSTWLMADLVQGPRYLYPGPDPRWMRLDAVVATAPGSNGEFVTKGREGLDERGPLGDDITRLRERKVGPHAGYYGRRSEAERLAEGSHVSTPATSLALGYKRSWGENVGLGQEAGDLSFLFISYFISVFYFNFNSKPSFEFQIWNLDAQTNNSACYVIYILIYQLLCSLW
jgi:hypothetical protein